jgi:hypothetical protein
MNHEMIKNITEEISQIPQSKKALQKFGFTFSVIFFCMAIVTIYRHSIFYGMTFCWSTLSFSFLVIGLLAPSVLMFFYKCWFSLSIMMGYISSTFVLLFLFFFVITPVSLLLKMLKKDILNLRIVEKDSYWESTGSIEKKEQYTKMF